MKGEDLAAASIRLQCVGELRDGAGTLVAHRQWEAVGRHEFGKTFQVFGRLSLHALQGKAFRLGLDDADSPTVCVEKVVGEAVSLLERELAYGHAGRGPDVHVPEILNRPSASL